MLTWQTCFLPKILRTNRGNQSGHDARGSSHAGNQWARLTNLYNMQEHSEQATLQRKTTSGANKKKRKINLESIGRPKECIPALTFSYFDTTKKSDRTNKILNSQFMILWINQNKINITTYRKKSIAFSTINAKNATSTSGSYAYKTAIGYPQSLRSPTSDTLYRQGQATATKCKFEKKNKLKRIKPKKKQQIDTVTKTKKYAEPQ